MDVFYIDYGNQSQVTLNELREITPDLVENHPKSYALNCDLTILNTPSNLNMKEFNIFFLKVIDFNFEVKYQERKSKSKYMDTSVYEVDLYERDSKKTLLNLYLLSSDNANNTNTNQVTLDVNVKAENPISNAIENMSFINVTDRNATGYISYLFLSCYFLLR